MSIDDDVLSVLFCTFCNVAEWVHLPVDMTNEDLEPKA